MTKAYFVGMCLTFVFSYILLLDKVFSLKSEHVDIICRYVIAITIMAVLLVWVLVFVTDALPEIKTLCVKKAEMSENNQDESQL